MAKIFKRSQLTRKMRRARAKRLLKLNGSWKLRRLGEGKWWLP